MPGLLIAAIGRPYCRLHNGFEICFRNRIGLERESTDKRWLCAAAGAPTRPRAIPAPAAAPSFNTRRRSTRRITQSLPNDSDTVMLVAAFEGVKHRQHDVQNGAIADLFVRQI